MRVFENKDPASLPERSHPWSVVTGDGSLRYEDFRRYPERIRDSLEDFRELGAHPAGQRFYRLVEWINGGESPLESNDSALWAVEPNESATLAGRLLVSGRVMILFRELALNTEQARVAALMQAVARACEEADRGFLSGAIGLSVVRVRYRALAPGAQQGEQLLISFWAAGDTLPDVWRNLDRTFVVLGDALRSPGVAAAAS